MGDHSIPIYLANGRGSPPIEVPKVYAIPAFAKKSSSFKSRFFKTITVVSGLCIAFMLYNSYNNSPDLNRFSKYQHLLRDDTLPRDSIVSDTSEKNVIEVGNPYVYRGDPVHTTVLVDDTLSESFTGHYSPPDVRFNRVAATLKVSVSEAQFARLVHFSLAGNEIWRSSTVESPGYKVSSSFQKDLSLYTSLFYKESPFILELKNKISDYHPGSIHVQLSLAFFDDGDLIADDSAIASLESRPADKVVPLTFGDVAHSPVKHFPHESITGNLPQLNHNTSRAILSVKASGHNNEELWYSGDKAGSKSPGPARFVNLYVDGKKVGVLAPEPLIFSGSLLPDLWRAVVSTDTFDLPSYDFDITPLLPLLWKESQVRFTITISNGNNESKNKESLIEDEWITSASLFAFENPAVESATGYLLGTDHYEKGSTISLPWFRRRESIVTSTLWAYSKSKIDFNLKNGTHRELIVSSGYNATTDNVQKSHSDKYDLVHEAKNTHFLDVEENGKRVNHTVIKTEFPFVYNQKEDNYSIVKTRDTYLYSPVSSVEVSRVQIGKGISSKEPRAKLSTVYKIEGETLEGGSISYDRLVEVKNARIVYDSTDDDKTTSNP